MTKTTIELLREARKWLSVEAHWCAGKFMNSNGSTCALGALASFGLEMPEAQSRSIERLAQAVRLLDETSGWQEGWRDGACVVWFNDTAGHKCTLEMFDLAINLEQEEMDRHAKELVESSVSEAAAIGH